MSGSITCERPMIDRYVIVWAAPSEPLEAGRPRAAAPVSDAARRAPAATVTIDRVRIGQRDARLSGWTDEQGVDDGVRTGGVPRRCARRGPGRRARRRSAARDAGVVPRQGRGDRGE